MQKSSKQAIVAAIILVVSVPVSAVPTVDDAGFEAPVQPGTGFSGFEQAGGTGNGTLAGSAWTFSPSAGISRNGSSFQNNGEVAAEGQQLGLIQGAGFIEQTLSGFTIGETYSVTLAHRARVTTNDQDLRVLVDGQVIGGGRTNNDQFRDHTTAFFVATSETPTLRFQSANLIGGDTTAFIDDVRINALGVINTPTLSNASFEDGSSQSFPGYAPADGWGSVATSTGINGTGIGQSAFLNGLSAVDGDNVGFTQSSTGLTQNIVGLQAGKAYRISYYENERGANASAVASASVSVDGTVIVADHAVTRGDWNKVVSDTFVATGVSMELMLSNAGANNVGDNTALWDNFTIERAVPLVADGGFENPLFANNTFEQASGTGTGDLSGSAWAFTGGAGMTRDLSGFQNGVPAEEGDQHALIQAAGAISQLIEGFEVDTYYSLSLLTMARQGQAFGNDLEVVLDAGLVTEIVLIDLAEVTFDDWTELESLIFRAQKTSYTLTLRASKDGGNLIGDRTTMIDAVRFNIVPEPASVSLLALGAAAVLGRRRRAA